MLLIRGFERRFWRRTLTGSSSRNCGRRAAATRADDDADELQREQTTTEFQNYSWILETVIPKPQPISVVVMKSDREREEMHRSKVGSMEHRVLAFSWEAFGLNEAFDRTLI